MKTEKEIREKYIELLKLNVKNNLLDFQIIITTIKILKWVLEE